MITIIGDVHGKIKQYQQLLATLPEGQRSIQIGDMGVGFVPAAHPPLQHKFFRGNHDDPGMCKNHTSYMGDSGFLPEDSLFWVAGAWSIDWMYREKNVSWWEDEELSVEELNRAVDSYIDAKPRFMLSHEAPTIVATQMLSGLTMVSSSPDNPVNVRKDDKYRYYKAKMGCVNTRTSQALQSMLDAWTPEEWVFGHYHSDQTFKVDGYRTKFTCVAELSTYDLDTGR